MIVARPVTPESGKPPPKPLAVVITSGTTPECSMENILPVRAMPPCTSSAIITMPCSSHRRRSARRKSKGATLKPPSPCTGSMMMAAIDFGSTSIAAIIIEPVQGEGGFNVAPFDFLRALRRLCDEHGIVMIADEVQGGIARTGKMFSIEHSGVVPDVITTAKGLGGGFPLSGVTGRATIMDAAHAGGLGGTYGGNPISIAAAHPGLEGLG